MAHKNPLGKIKDVASASMKAPVTVAGSAVGSAVGLAKATTGRAAGVVGALVGAGTQESDAPSPAPTPERPPAPTETASPVFPSEPVNVTEQLGLDPAPVAKPKRAAKKPAKKPVTKIDAAAEANDVDVTPADVADSMGTQVPERKEPSE